MWSRDPYEKSDNLPLLLPKFTINGITIKRQNEMKFLGVLLDENLSWKAHISTIKNKISKNIGLLYKARYIVKNHCLKQLYFSYIQSHLSYGNIVWGSTNQSKLLPLYRKQKHAARIIFFKDKLTHAKPLLSEINTLSLYQLNLFQTLDFMYKTNKNLVPVTFKGLFIKCQNKYTLKSADNYSKPFKSSKLDQFSISYSGPHLWNKLLDFDQIREI